MPPPPPPPPPPPSAPSAPSSASKSTAPSKPPSMNGDRSMLLNQIRKGKALKPSETNDRSKPMLGGSKPLANKFNTVAAHSNRSINRPIPNLWRQGSIKDGKIGQGRGDGESSHAVQPSGGGGVGNFFPGGIPKLPSKGPKQRLTAGSSPKPLRPPDRVANGPVSHYDKFPSNKNFSNGSVYSENSGPAVPRVPPTNFKPKFPMPQVAAAPSHNKPGLAQGSGRRMLGNQPPPPPPARPPPATGPPLKNRPSSMIGRPLPPPPAASSSSKALPPPPPPSRSHQAPPPPPPPPERIASAANIDGGTLSRSRHPQQRPPQQRPPPPPPFRPPTGPLPPMSRNLSQYGSSTDEGSQRRAPPPPPPSK